MPNIGGKTYGFCMQKAMGYGLLRTYGLWYAISRLPSWWTGQAMGYKGLWVIRGMGYEGFDCSMVGKPQIILRRIFL